MGASKAVDALGENFAVFRDEEGKIHILDAYCAHLGANIAVGGKVCPCMHACMQMNDTHVPSSQG